MSQSRRDAFVRGALAAANGTWSKEEAEQAAALAYPTPVGLSAGAYTIDAAIDGDIVKWYIEAKAPTDEQLRAFIAAEIAPYCEAVVYMARDDQQRGTGPWGK